MRQRLTDAKLRKAKPAAKPYKLTDGGGLHLYVEPNGARRWRYRYRLDGAERTYTLGDYPALTLAAARAAHATARELVRAGVDPVATRRREQAAEAARVAAENAARAAAVLTFGKVAAAWHAAQSPRWTPKHAARVLTCLTRDLAPLADTPIGKVTADAVLDCIRAIEANHYLDHSKRTLQRARGVMRYALAMKHITADPLAVVRELFTPTTRTVRHRPALPASELPTFWQRLDVSGAHVVNKLALQLLMYTMLRPGELRAGRWSEINVDGALWAVPGHRMKVKTRRDQAGNPVPAPPHKVPLSRQALTLLEQLQTYTGGGPLLFPSERDPTRPISDGTLGGLMNRLGYKGVAVPHGFRTLASSTLNESNRFHADAVELQLAHVDADETRRAYNRTDRLAERVRMMQWYADWLDSTRPGNNVIPIGRPAG